MRAGLRVVVLEAADGVGGRVRTDAVGGYLLDRGFQIFLMGYPTQKAELDYEALRLRPFYAGALVRYDGAWHRCTARAHACASAAAALLLLTTGCSAHGRGRKVHPHSDCVWTRHRCMCTPRALLQRRTRARAAGWRTR
jgi:monoamine oxidase